uniref:2,3-bisphosphoglycerate-dependent phosphoglycerate mutase n=1 Tax=Streptobacillus moniliformis TaxID=34105 RepID=UPI000A3DDAC6
TAKQYGEEQVHIWRRSFDVAPPQVKLTDEVNYPRFQERYKDIPESECPRGESLKDTIARVLPYWETNISKEIKAGKDVIVVAHGNSLRSLIKYLLNIDDVKIFDLNLPTGKPLVFEIIVN